jgi:hypothetical protein
MFALVNMDCHGVSLGIASYAQASFTLASRRMMQSQLLATIPSRPHIKSFWGNNFVLNVLPDHVIWESVLLSY